MGNIRKQSRKKRFGYTRDRKRIGKHVKKLPKLKCDALRDAWDEKKSIELNMREMGLSADANKTLRIPTTKELLTVSEDVEMNTASKKKKKKKKAKKQHVVDSLEEMANAPQERTLRLSEPDVKYCISMIEKYGEDYKAMARDHRNYYQDTPKQIRKKINTFKNIPEQYNEYLRSKVYLSPVPGICVAGVSWHTPVTMVSGRRITRGYEAGRRNGHYSATPTSTDSLSSVCEEKPFSHVRRRLKFGRKPPKEREATPASSSTSSRSNKSTRSKKSSTSTSRRIQKKVKGVGAKLKRELEYLLDTTVVLPVRLRSAVRDKGHKGGGKKDSQKGYPLKSSPEGTNLTRKKQKRSKEVVTQNIYVSR